MSRPTPLGSRTLDGVFTRLRAADPDPELAQRLDAVFARYEGRLLAQCRRELRGFPEAEVEEVAQDVFVEAWTKLAEFRGEGRFLSFLIGIAVRKCANARRRKRDLLSTDGVLEAASEERSVLQALSDEERDQLVAAAAGAVLDAREQEIVNLRWVLDYPQEDIARIVELPDANEVRVVLQRCKRRMEREIRRLLSARGHGTSFLR